MSSRPISEARRGPRAFRPARRRAAWLLLAALAVCGGSLSCRDDIERPADPNGHLLVRLHSTQAGGYAGGVLSLDGTVLVADIQDSVYSFVRSPGHYRLALEKACTSISPASSISFDLSAGEHLSLAFEVQPLGGVEVVSSPAGAEIRLDGLPTGERTPVTLSCLSHGAHVISVSLLGASAGNDSARAIVVTSEPQTVSFSLQPLDQPPGCLLELFTASLCTYCPIADAAVDSLLRRPDLTAGGFMGVQVHLSFANSDPFYVQAGTQRQIDFYNTNSGPPTAMVNGTRRQQLGTNPTVASSAGLYESLIRAVQNGSEGPAHCALYWLSAERTPGAQIRGTVRVMLTSDLTAADSLRLTFLDYKDGLPDIGPHGEDAIYHNVVRAYRYAGNLTRDLDLLHRGDYADVTVTFDLSGDTQWSESRMGLVAFVQDAVGRHIVQMAHRAVN